MLMTQVKGRTQEGRVIDLTLAVGMQADDYTVFHVLGTVEFRGQEWAIDGTINHQPDRSEPNFGFRRLDTCEGVRYAVGLDILYAVYAVLDERNDALMQEENDRIYA